MAKLIDVLAQPRPIPQDRGGIVRPSPGGTEGDQAVAAGIRSLGINVQEAATELFRAQKVEEDRIDTLRAEEAYTKLRERQLDLTIGEQNGFSQVRGSAAVSRPLYTEWGAKFEDAQKEVAGTLSNARQRERFGQRADVARLQYHEDMLRHLSREGDAYAKEVYAGILSTEQASAVARWNEPANVAASIVRMNAAIDREAERSGWPEQDIAATKRAQESQVHRGVIGMMVTNDEEKKAQSYYDAVKGKLTAGDQLAVQSLLEQARRHLEDDIWEGVSQGIQEGGTAVFKDPALFDETYNSQKKVIDDLKDVTERNRVKWRHELYVQLAKAKIRGMARTDPEGTAAMLRGDTRGYIEGGEPTGEPTRANLELYAAKQEAYYNLPPGLLRGLIEQESGWVHRKDSGELNKSPKGAIGLGQLMPGTASDLGVDPADPYENVRGAAKYLADLLEYNGGDVQKALAAYNAGQKRVNEAGGIPNIPETQQYVPSVMSRAERYKAQGPPPDETPTMVSTGYDFVDKMPLDLRIQMLHEITTMANQGQALLRHRLKSKLEDFTAMAHSGVDIPLTSIPTEHELVRAWGPVDGAQMYQDVQGSLQLNSDIKQVRSMPYQDQDQLVTQRTPTPGPGFHDAAQRQQSLARAIDYVRKEQKDDPAGWTMSNTKTVRDAWSSAQEALQNVQNNPGDQVAGFAATKALEDYAVATLAEQERIGMAPKVLTNAMADMLVQSFYKGQKEGGQNAAQLISSLSQQWGKYWPEVYSQISKQIPSAARTIGSGMKTETSAMRLAGLADVKREELAAGLPSGIAKDINDRINENFTEGRISLVGTNAREGGKIFDAFRNDAEKLALSYAQGGKSWKEAADQAYDEVFGHRYQFVKSGPVYYRVPRGEEWQNATAVSRGADLTRARLSGADLAPPTSLAGLKPDEAAAQFADVVRANGYWVTVGEPGHETGLALYDPQGAAVLGSNGKPIYRTWIELYETSKAPTEYQRQVQGVRAEEMVRENIARGRAMISRERAAAPPLPREMQGGQRVEPILPLAAPIEAPPAGEERQGGQMAEPILPLAKPIAPATKKQRAKPESFEALEGRLREIAKREQEAGKLASEARDANDVEGWKRRAAIIDALFKDRQDLMKRLRKLDPRRAEALWNELYLQ